MYFEIFSAKEATSLKSTILQVRRDAILISVSQCCPSILCVVFSNEIIKKSSSAEFEV